MLEESTESESSRDDLPKPPSGRRSSTRPAGPPAPVVFAEGELPVPVERKTKSNRKKTAEIESNSSPKPDTPAFGEEERKTTRKRTTRKTASRTVAVESAPTDVEDALAAAQEEAGQRLPRKKGMNKKSAQTLLGDDVDDTMTTAEALETLAAAIADNLGVSEPENSSLDTGNDEVTESVLTDRHQDITDGDAPPDEDHGETGTEGEEDTPTPSRRRRRRGGRRRRRSTEEHSPADEETAVVDMTEPAEAEKNEAVGDNDDEQPALPSRRRRRRRRRRGEDTSGADDDPSDVIVRVREPRRNSQPATDEVTGIEGSTRMEAKKQRRREGRAAGRRRAPILTEAEFLARRESVERMMVIRQNDEYTQVAVLEDGILVEHYVDRASAASLIGNIYLGKVQNVLPSMEAAFIDIGRGRNAVLYAGEVDWDSYDVQGEDRKVEQVLKSGQSVLVQVSKDPVGAKGARLTGHISLPGRYVVYSPDGHLSGISRKLPDTERQRLKGILSEVVGDESSVIVRTAAEGASEAELVRDVERLKAQWEIIQKKVRQGGAPQQLYAEPDLTLRIVRDLFTEDFCSLVIAGNGGPDDAFETIKAYVEHIAPHLLDRVSKWDEKQGDLFTQYRIDEQVSKALERKVFLPSGGSLVIDRTEAMTVIDVNTGKFTGTGGNLEETVTKNNLEAAEEVVRQLRLRDIGGIVMIDFIDMVLPSNRELLLRRLVECLGRDRTRHQVSEVTSLGLVQMTRKKIGTGLAEAFTEQCECCGGRGYIRYDMPVDSQAPADGGERKNSH